MGVLISIFTNEALRNFAVILGVLVALSSIKAARSIARKKQAADLLFNSRENLKLQEAARCIDKHHYSKTSNIRSLADKEAMDLPETALIRLLLNHFELVSVGIQNDIYDEKMIKDSWCTIIVRTYDQALPFITAVRERDKKDTIYQEFELLAKRWKQSPLKEKKKWRGAWKDRMSI
jgi:hypothetical protein